MENAIVKKGKHDLTLATSDLIIGKKGNKMNKHSDWNKCLSSNNKTLFYYDSKVHDEWKAFKP